jgi:hypothetical protein
MEGQAVARVLPKDETKRVYQAIMKVHVGLETRAASA